ncbi:MAG: phosphonate metabolism protein/1,5-bisphosphokinase (PRPP-forming) PhnN, partial [Pseudomonadota bacterium]
EGGGLVAVVGPSGVGKDSVIDGMVAAAPWLSRVQRVITRPPSGSEPFESVSEAEFLRRKETGAFALHWQAHGLSYGLPAATMVEIAGGGVRIANLSRRMLGHASEVFPRLAVLSLTASPETIADRLAGRGRETAAEIAARLARHAPLPTGLDVVEIRNDGALSETVSQALAALAPLRGKR